MFQFEIHKVPPDGNCQFHAILFILKPFFPSLTLDLLRRIVVRRIERTDVDFLRGVLMDAPVHFSDNNTIFKSQVIDYYSKNGTYGDQFSLDAISKFFKIGFIVLSSSGDTPIQLLGNTFRKPYTRVAILRLSQFGKNSGHYDVLGVKINGSHIWSFDLRNVHHLLYWKYILNQLHY